MYMFRKLQQSTVQDHCTLFKTKTMFLTQHEIQEIKKCVETSHCYMIDNQSGSDKKCTCCSNSAIAVLYRCK